MVTELMHPQDLLFRTGTRKKSIQLKFKLELTASDGTTRVIESNLTEPLVVWVLRLSDSCSAFSFCLRVDKCWHSMGRRRGRASHLRGFQVAD